MPATKSRKPAKATKNPAKAVETPAAETKPETKAKATAKAVERDSLGQRVGSQAATINAQLSAKVAKTSSQIAEATGINAPRVRSHLVSLVAKEKAKSTDDGYILVKAK
jgi:predicted HTH transcriptional regulator